jgi:hypothetical protein
MKIVRIIHEELTSLNYKHISYSISSIRPTEVRFDGKGR